MSKASEHYFSATDLERLCAYCGRKGTQHGGGSNPHRPYACPADGKAPTWPKLKDEKKAGALFDKRLAKYWTQRTTAFRPIK